MHVDNDEEFLIGIEAFCEAVDKYDASKGAFLSFARLLINQRLINHQKKENRHRHQPLEEADRESASGLVRQMDEEVVLRLEIQELEQELQRFGITFDDLVSNGPKHTDTRERARQIAHQAAEDEAFVRFLYEKRRLPVTRMCSRYKVSKKVIRRSSKYIISIMVILSKEFDSLKNWI